MKTAILILNWNGGNDTVSCLQSLLPHVGKADYIFVIDNGSTDNSIEDLNRYFSSVQKQIVTCKDNQLPEAFDPQNHIYLILNSKNLGFGGGNNTVLTQLLQLDASFELAWLLNNDAQVNAETLESLKQSMAKNDKIAVAGSLILNFPDTATIQCSGVKYYKWLGVSKLINKNLPYNALDRSAPITFDYLNGASFLFRLTALKESGYFDERFFLYSEEQDLELRLQKKGYRLYLDLNSIVYHKLSGATSASRHLFYYYYNSSAVLLSKKHFSSFVTACAVLNLCAITFIRTFPSFKNFRWGLKGIIEGITK